MAMNKRIETASRTPRLALAMLMLVLALTLNASDVSAADSSLELSDFNRGGLEVEVAALFEAGGAGSEAALYSASGSRWTESGSLVDGEALLGEDSSIVRVMLPKSDGSLLRLNDGGPLVLRDYFGSSGGGADLTMWIQTAQGAVSFAASDVRSVGSNYVNFNVPQAARSTLSGIASGDRFILALTRPAPAAEPTPTPQPTATPEPTPEPPQNPPRGVEVFEEEEEPSVGKRQQVDDPPPEADTCAPEIESVGGSASNGNVQWKWKSVAPPAPAPGVDGCESRWVDFRLSYSDDYGATFTGAEVVRRYIHNTDTETITIGGKELNRNEEYHSASTPELSIVSKLRVEVGCDADGANCAHSLDSTPGSFKPYYRSRYAGRDDGANTEALLAPANYCTDCWGNASVIGWLDIGEDPHTYRIHMTAGKTYVFDETYRKWALTSGEWRGGPHFYLPDEFRLSLFTKNSAGELVAVSDFQDQPENGWQAIHDDYSDDYQSYGGNFANLSVPQFFQAIKDVKNLFAVADFFPPGDKHRHSLCCSIRPTPAGHGLDLYWYDGRQLRNASYTPTETGVYYLTVTRTADKQPVWRSAHGYSIIITTNGGDQALLHVGVRVGANSRTRNTQCAAVLRAVRGSQGPHAELDRDYRRPLVGAIPRRELRVPARALQVQRGPIRFGCGELFNHGTHRDRHSRAVRRHRRHHPCRHELDYRRTPDQSSRRRGNRHGHHCHPRRQHRDLHHHLDQAMTAADSGQAVQSGLVVQAATGFCGCRPSGRTGGVRETNGLAHGIKGASDGNEQANGNGKSDAAHRAGAAGVGPHLECKWCVRVG